MTETHEDEFQDAQDSDSNESDEGVEIPINSESEDDSEQTDVEDDNASASSGEGDESVAPDDIEFGGEETATETPTVDESDDATPPESSGESTGSPSDGELDDLYLDPDEDAEVVEEDGDQPSSDTDEDSRFAEADRSDLVERIDELEERVDELQQERDEMEDRMYRAAADLENFRKRAKREKEELEKYGAKDVILEMLPAIDNLERALEHTDQDDEEGGSADKGKSIVDGVDMTLRQLHTALEKHGIEVFDAEGDQFDPELHEAMQQVETDEQPPGTVVEQFQRGYTIKDRLLRPALVAVAKQPESTSDAETADGAEDAADGSEDSPEDGDQTRESDQSKAERVDEQPSTDGHGNDDEEAGDDSTSPQSDQ